MFMQVGFALVETGFIRAKNAAHTMFMNFTVCFLSLTGFYICGYALMMGGVSFIPSTSF
jgi:ammonium transporter, Amt family